MCVSLKLTRLSWCLAPAIAWMAWLRMLEPILDVLLERVPTTGPVRRSTTAVISESFKADTAILGAELGEILFLIASAVRGD